MHSKNKMRHNHDQFEEVSNWDQKQKISERRSWHNTTTNQRLSIELVDGGFSPITKKWMIKVDQTPVNAAQTEMEAVRKAYDLAEKGNMSKITVENISEDSPIEVEEILN